jgi:mitochondrial fission protein ELM1
MGNRKIIWQICDGKRGHENQSAGLIHALSQKLTVEVIRIELSQYKASWWQALRAQFPTGKVAKEPDLIIATGSQTHATLLAAGRASGAPTILIMAPPRGLTSFFDLCVIPTHDERKGANVIETTGAMNTVESSEDKETQSGLFLIGGPSQHHNWDEASLLKQISTIVASNTGLQWKLTTSRRTPASTTDKLLSLEGDQLEVIPVEDTEADWLPQQLAHSAYAWVTEDSVSMVYEALSSGAKVGLLPVPRKTAQSRIIRGLDSLKANNYILSYSENQPDLANFKSPPPLKEAERVAKIVIQRFF